MANPYVRIRKWQQAGDGSEARAVEPLWYACYTRARHEKRVARVLRDRGVERFLPLVAQERQWHDRTKLVEVPLFPGYLFVRIGTAQMFDVACVPSVVTIVMAEGNPIAIADEEIENIRRFAAVLTDLGTLPESRALPADAPRARILAGPFAGIEGWIDLTDEEGQLVVGITALDVGFSIRCSSSDLTVLGDF
jgi:transcription antitermination factor NusG